MFRNLFILRFIIYNTIVKLINTLNTMKTIKKFIQSLAIGAAYALSR